MHERANQRRRNIPVEDLTAANYVIANNNAQTPQMQEQIEEKEKGLYHVLIEVKKFNSDTGARLSKPRVQKFGQKTFQAIREDLIKQGYTLTILHDPREYLESKTQEAQAAAKQKQEQDRLDKEKRDAELKKQQDDEAQKRIDDAIAEGVKNAMKGIQENVDKQIKDGIAKGLKDQAPKAAKAPKAEETKADAKAANADSKAENGASDTKGTETK